MASTTIEADVITLRGNAIILDGAATIPPSSVGDTAVRAAAGIAASKLEHLHHKTYQKAGNVASEGVGIHVARAAGVVESVKAFLIGPNVGAATYAVDLKKNGASILTAEIEFDSGDAARAVLTGAIASAGYVDGDVFEVVTVATAGGGTLGTNACVDVRFREGA